MTENNENIYEENNEPSLILQHISMKYQNDKDDDIPDETTE